ncbi:MAG: hypothetical protein QGG48_11895, partial [Desulfatiglandales bacterium]|nr:hypothetical protein [Desulfatiglandales bacterium]
MISSVGVFRYVRVAATDSLLVFSLTLSLYGSIRAMTSDEKGEEFGREKKVDRPHLSENAKSSVGFQFPMILFYLGMSLALLSKGLIGLVFPVFIVGLFLLLGDEPGRRGYPWSLGGRIRNLFKSVWSPIGFFIFFVLALPWHLLAAWSNNGFVQFYLLDNQFLRFLNSRGFIEDDVPIGTFVFLIMLLVWFFPWSVFIPGAIREGFPGSRTRNESPTANLRPIVGIWFVTILAFFSLSGSKLEHYFLPLIPPLSLMVGSLWSKALSFSDDGHLCVESAPVRRRMMWCLGSGALCCLSIGLGLIIFSAYLTPQSVLNGLAELNVYYRILQARGIALPFASISPFVLLVKAVGLALLVGTLISFALFYFKLPKASFVSVLCQAGVIGALVVKLLFLIETHHSAKFVAEAMGSHLGSGDVIVHEGSL